MHFFISIGWIEQTNIIYRFKEINTYITVQNNMPNYQDGNIYKIVCNITDECYIGSTCEPTVARRLAGHVIDYKR
jgi:hypothetical protein